MIIHQPEINYQHGEIFSTSCIETQQTLDQPPNLWFSFPEEYQPCLTERCDGFATSLLMLAMYYGESLEIKGAISDHLAYGMLEWMRAFHSLFPQQFELIEIKFDQIQQASKPDDQWRVGLGFSGGIDSIYALWCHLPENQPIPSARLTHALFVHGFDIPLNKADHFQKIAQQYHNELKDLGIDLLTSRTNAFEFYHLKVKPELFHGGPLIGSGLMLGGLFDRFYLAPANAFQHLSIQVDGSSALTDHLLSTERTQILHFGTHLPKQGRMEVIQDWSFAQHNLRVCTNVDLDHGKLNCGHCVRCLQAMLRLEIMGKLDEFKTLFKQVRLIDYFHLAFTTQYFAGAYRSMCQAAIKAGRLNIAISLACLVIVDTIKQFLATAILKRLSKEKRHALKRWLFK